MTMVGHVLRHLRGRDDIGRSRCVTLGRYRVPEMAPTLCLVVRLSSLWRSELYAMAAPSGVRSSITLPVSRGAAVGLLDI